MRRLGSEAELEKKKKRNTLIVSIIILGVLIFGTAGYAFVSSPGTNQGAGDQYAVDGEAKLIGNRWVITRDGGDLRFTHSPTAVENITVDFFKLPISYAGRILYIVSDNSAIASEIATTLGTYASRVQLACHGPCEEDLPEKDCSDNLIIWRDSLDSRIYQDEDCIFIEGDLRAVDAFLYRTFNVQ